MTPTSASKVTAPKTPPSAVAKSTTPPPTPHSENDPEPVVATPKAAPSKPLGKYVTVLHGYGRVSPADRAKKLGASKKLYDSAGGVVRHVLREDAEHWVELFGSQYLKILPDDATEADYAQATGIVPMELHDLTAMIEAVDLGNLVSAWGTPRALRFAEKLTRYIADTQR